MPLRCFMNLLSIYPSLLSVFINDYAPLVYIRLICYTCEYSFINQGNSPKIHTNYFKIKRKPIETR